MWSTGAKGHRGTGAQRHGGMWSTGGQEVRGQGRRGAKEQGWHRGKKVLFTKGCIDGFLGRVIVQVPLCTPLGGPSHSTPPLPLRSPTPLLSLELPSPLPSGACGVPRESTPAGAGPRGPRCVPPLTPHAAPRPSSQPLSREAPAPAPLRLCPQHPPHPPPCVSTTATSHPPLCAADSPLPY